VSWSLAGVIRAHARADDRPLITCGAETLPRNPSGKLLKRELREQYWRGHDRRINEPTFIRRDPWASASTTSI
jgi:acyl-CoA synthetase (AMP-forming)/AMP-acid ligase II